MCNCLTIMPSIAIQGTALDYIRPGVK